MGDEQATSVRPHAPSWWYEARPRKARPARPGRRRALVIIAIVVGLAVIASLVAFMYENSTHHTIIGALDVGTLQTNSQCRLDPIYQGIRKGTDVVVRDTHGTVIGRTSLGPGKGVGPYCEFLFAVRVPNRDLYSISIDDRGHITYSRAYFDFFRWRAGLALQGAKLTWL